MTPAVAKMYAEEEFSTFVRERGGKYTEKGVDCVLYGGEECAVSRTSERKC